jgi:hypothetical protein
VTFDNRKLSGFALSSRSGMTHSYTAAYGRFGVRLMLLFYGTLFICKQPRPIIGGLASVVILATMLLLNAGNVRPLFYALRAVIGEISPRSQLAFLAQYVGADEIVLVNQELGTMVSAFTGRVIASSRPLHWVTDAAQRRKAVSLVLDANATLEARCQALAAYRVDFILATPSERESLAALKALGILLYEDKDYALIRVSAAGPTSPDEPVRPKIWEVCNKS